MLLVGSVTSACGGGAGTGDKGYVDGQGIITRLSADERKRPGEVSGTTLDGKDLSLEKYAGKVVVLNVWGSWCAPCRAEAPELQQASLERADKAQFIGINSRDADPAPAEAFVRAFSVTYPSIYDADGKVLLNFAGNLPLSTFPSTLIIDRDGRIAVRISGTITKITLVNLIDDVAAGK